MASILGRARKILRISKALTATMDDHFRCAMPTQYFIDPGNICNLRCPLCPTGLRKQPATGLMSKEVFDAVFEKIKPYAAEIQLYNWGEPFMNKNLLHMCSRCSSEGFFSRVDTNLSLTDLAVSDAEAVVRSGVSELRVSCDGASQETYGLYRIGGSFDRVIRNMSLLCATRNRLGRRTPRVIYKFLVHRGNEHEIERARRLATDMGASFEYGLLHGPDPWTSSLHPAQEPPAACAGPKSEPAPEHPATCKGPKGEPALEPVHKVKREKGPACRIGSIKLHPRLCDWCIQPFKVMIINWDGHVVPCCNVYGPGHDMGSLVESSLEDVWNGSRFRASRKFLLTYGPQQDTGSVCELASCPVAEKYLVTT